MAAAAETALRNFVDGRQVRRPGRPDQRRRGSEHRRGLPPGAGLRRGRRGRRADHGRRRRSTPGGTPPRPSAAWPCSGSPTPIEARAEDLIEAESRNTGKPVTMTRTDEVPPLRRRAAVLRRRRAGAGGPVGGGVPGRPHLDDPARADRRLRPGHALELPDDDGGLEDRPGAGRGQHRRAQAVRHHPGVHAAAGRDRGRVPAAGRAQRDLRRPGHRPGAGRRTTSRRWSRSPARSGRASRSPRGRRGRPQARPPGTGRQGPGRGVRRRRPGRGRADDRRCRVLQRRPGLHRGDAGARRPRHRRRPDRRAGRAGPRAAHRRARPARRRLRPAQQPGPAGPGLRLRGPGAGPRHRAWPAATRSATAATATPRPWWPGCARTTR